MAKPLPSQTAIANVLLKLVKLPSFNIDDVLSRSEFLIRNVCYEQALLNYWIAIEQVCRDLVIYDKALSNATALWIKQERKLSAKCQNIDLKKHNLEGQLFDLIFTHSKSFYEAQYRYINIEEVRKALTTFNISFNPNSVNYLLANEIKELPESLNSKSKVTIRSIRNKVVHEAYIFKEDDFELIKSFPYEFLVMISGLTK